MVRALSSTHYSMAYSFAMIVAIGMAGMLFLLTLTVHCAAVRRLGRMKANGTGAFLVICSALAVLHFVEVGGYTVAFALGESMGIGSFDKVQSMSAMDTYYFSLVNLTTLGLGQVYPTGHLRFLAGFEAFNGFLCISMSASTVFRWVHNDA